MPVLLLSNVKQNVDNPLEICEDLTFERFREILYDVYKNIQKSDSSWQFLNSRVYVLRGCKHKNFSEQHRLAEVVSLNKQARDRPFLIVLVAEICRTFSNESYTSNVQTDVPARSVEEHLLNTLSFPLERLGCFAKTIHIDVSSERPSLCLSSSTA